MKKSIRKNLIVALGVCTFAGLTACAGYADTTAAAEIRVESARFYTEDDGTIVTADGNEWKYTVETLDDAFKCSDGSILFTGIEHEAKNDVPVWVRISDNGTAGEISDDEILSVGLDFGEYMDEIIAANNDFIATFRRNYKRHKYR